MVATQSYSRKCRAWFVNAVVPKQEVVHLETSLEKFAREVKRLLAIRPPVYFEDDPHALGICAVCNKKGSFNRCVSCGMLWHFSCLRSIFQCPRCSTVALEAFDPAKHGGLRRTKFKNGAILAQPVGIDKAVDPRVPCPLHVLPTDTDAVKNGFKDAREWYVFSAGGALAGQRAEANFVAMQRNSQPSSSSTDKRPDVQFWSRLNDPLGLDPNVEYDREGGVRASDGTVEHESNQPILGEDLPEPFDMTARVSESLGVRHPYLLSDVEV